MRNLFVATMMTTVFAYFAIVAACLRIRNGSTWRIYKGVLVCHLVASIGALGLVMTVRANWIPDIWSMLVMCFRMLGAFGNVALAYVLWRQGAKPKGGTPR